MTIDEIIFLQENTTGNRTIASLVKTRKAAVTLKNKSEKIITILNDSIKNGKKLQSENDVEGEITSYREEAKMYDQEDPNGSQLRKPQSVDAE